MTEFSHWIIIELSEAGCTASHEELQASLRDLLGGIEWFIPIHHEKMGSYTSTSVLFDGYVFVQDSPETRIRVADIRDFRFFSKVLGSRGKYDTVDSHTIGVLKRKLRESARRQYVVGSKVIILEGAFTDLLGEIISMEDEGKKVFVRVKRPSREMVVPLPSTSVRPANAVEIAEAEERGLF